MNKIMVLYKGVLNMVRTLKIYWDYEDEVEVCQLPTVYRSGGL